MRYLIVTNRNQFHPDKLFDEKRNSEPEMNLGDEQIPDPECHKILQDNEICLVFLTNCNTLAPHQLGFCKIGPQNIQRLCDIRRPDKVIEMHGHIIGMSLCPDSQLLYVNVRRWPENCVLSSVNPPAIAQEIELRVVDLQTLTLRDSVFSGHRAFTFSSDAFYIYIDISKDFVSSGSEDRSARIWDRHYECCVGNLEHRECVSSCAFSPTNQNLAVSVSDDFSIKVWKSKALIKELNIQQAQEKI